MQSMLTALVIAAFFLYWMYIVVPRVERNERKRAEQRREELWRVWFSRK